LSHRLPGEELGRDGRRAARRVLHPSLAGLLAAVSLYLAFPSLSWAQTADSLPRRLPIEDLPFRTGQVLTGQSVLRFIVDGSGRIDRCSIAIVEETTPAWTDAVVRELRSAHYQPARRQGQPVRQWVYQWFTYHSDGRLLHSR